MGGGSKSTTEKKTEVHTTTTTNIRDIGLTGQNAVDLAEVLEEGSISRSLVSADLVKGISELYSRSFENIGYAYEKAGEKAVAVQERALPRLIAAEAETQEADLTKVMPYMFIALAGIVFILKD